MELALLLLLLLLFRVLICILGSSVCSSRVLFFVGFLFDFVCLFGLGFRFWLLIFCSFVCLLFCFVWLVVAAAWGVGVGGGGRWGRINFWFLCLKR